MRSISRLPKKPKVGMVSTIMVRGRPVRFMSTGKKGFGAWKIMGKD
jgi:hypothetical protein